MEPNEHSSHQHHDHGHDHHAHDHGHSHAHGHAHALPAEGINLRMGVAVALNLLFVLIEGGFGFISNSVALIADAGHNLSDVLGLVCAWGAYCWDAAARVPSLPTASADLPFWPRSRMLCCCCWLAARLPGRLQAGSRHHSLWPEKP